MLLNFAKLGGLQLSRKTIKLSWVEIFQVGIILGGNFPGGNCPVRIIRVTIIQVGVFMLPFFSTLKHIAQTQNKRNF